MKLILWTCLALAPAIYAGSAIQSTAQQSANDQHAAGVDSRGDHAMGFSHETTKHHFELLPDGGIIAVDANKADDTATRDEIRMHLTHIAAMFSANNFDVPMFIHETVPPGVPVMKEKHEVITYTYQPTPAGGIVRIVTRNPAAIQAVHDFLAFQIADHRTGDGAAVKGPS